jgi:hypothetical protein
LVCAQRSEKIDKKELGFIFVPALLKVAKVAKQVASEGIYDTSCPEVGID